MKRSSTILISAIGCLVILAFISPKILLKKSEERHNPVLILEKTGNDIEIQFTEYFNRVYTFIDDKNYYIQAKPDVNALRMIIIETDSIDAPRFIADKSWCDNIELEADDEDLSIHITMKSLVPDKEDEFYQVEVPADNGIVGKLLLPKGYPLKYLSSPNIDVNLKDFYNLYMEISYYTDFTLNNCQVNTLSRNCQ